MNRNLRTYFMCAAFAAILFVLFTVLVACWDVRPAGPAQTDVGMATVNGLVFDAVGIHPVWKDVTEWLGAVAILTALAFALEGLWQLIRRKSLLRVDRNLWALAGFYLLLAACWLLFEKLAINCRPVLLGAEPEPSYPSSHVLLVVGVMGSASAQLCAAYPEKRKLCAWARGTAFLLSAAAAIGRLLAGVHWFTDVVGALLLCFSLLMLHRAVLSFPGKCSKL